MYPAAKEPQDVSSCSLEQRKVGLQSSDECPRVYGGTPSNSTCYSGMLDEGLKIYRGTRTQSSGLRRGIVTGCFSEGSYTFGDWCISARWRCGVNTRHLFFREGSHQEEGEAPRSKVEAQNNFIFSL
jgi:hypothetical protein